MDKPARIRGSVPVAIVAPDLTETQLYDWEQEGDFADEGLDPREQTLNHASSVRCAIATVGARLAEECLNSGQNGVLPENHPLVQALLGVRDTAEERLKNFTVFSSSVST